MKPFRFYAALAVTFLCSAWASDTSMSCEAYRELLRSQGVKELPLCPNKPGNGVPPAGGACACVRGLYTCHYTLADFQVSYFTHPNMVAFSRQIANDIQVYGAERVHFLQIVGFADGTSDENGAGHWYRVPEICRKKSPEDIFYDKALARVRACMVHYNLQSVSQLTLNLLSRDIDPADLKGRDFPTSREYEEGKYRKVEVEFTVERICQ